MKLPFIIPNGIKQTWRSLVTVVNEEENKIVFINKYNLDTILNSYASGLITESDINVLKFLMERKYGTPSQLAKACYPGQDINKVKKRLSKFIRNQLLDCFVWEYTENNYKMTIYCLGPGGFHLLKSINPEKLRYWSRHNNIQPIEKVAAILFTNEFTLKLPYDDQVLISEPIFKLSMGKVSPTSVFKYRENNFVIKTIRGLNNFNNLIEEMPKYENLIEENGWNKYFENPPILIFIVESDEMAFRLNDHIKNNSILNKFRFTTDERIMFKDLNKAFFVIDNQKIITKKAKIFEVLN